MKSLNCIAEAEKAMREYERYFDETYLEKALDWYCQAIANDSDYGETYYQRSFVYGLLEEYDSQLKDLGKAIKIFEDKFKRDPGNDEILLNIGMAYQHYYPLDNHMKHAWHYLNKALEANPANVKAAFGLADILKYDKREYELAISYYSKAIQLEILSADYYLERGECFEFLKKFDDAFEDYKRGIFLNPEKWQLYNRRGELHMRLKQWEEARLDYKNYRKYAPNMVRTPSILLEKNKVGGPYIEFYFAGEAKDHGHWNRDSCYLEDSIFVEFYCCFAKPFPNFSVHGCFEYSLKDMQQVKDALIESLGDLDKIHRYHDFIEHTVKTQFIFTMIRCFNDWEIHWSEWLEQLKDINSNLISYIDDAMGNGKRLYLHGI